MNTNELNEAAEKYADELIEAKSLRPHERTWFYHCLITFTERFKAEQKPSAVSDEKIEKLAKP